MSNWFYENGELKKDIPQECIADCSHGGQCFEDIKYWQEKLGFVVPRETAINYLKEYGAWDQKELEEMSIVRLSYTVLWLACCDISENGEWFGLIH